MTLKTEEEARDERPDRVVQALAALQMAHDAMRPYHTHFDSRFMRGLRECEAVIREWAADILRDQHTGPDRDCPKDDNGGLAGQVSQ